MKQPPLIKTKLIKRYKRFLVDVELENGDIVTVHCANSGSMMGLLTAGNTVYITPSINPENKLKYKLEFVENNSSMVGVNTHLTNKLVHEALENKLIEQLKHFDIIRPETKYNNSRFDFFLSNSNGEQAFVEVKNVTLLREPRIAEFPDAKTERGAKHLSDLVNVVQNEENISAYNLYIVQRTDSKQFKIAKDIDPKYYENFMIAKNAGVKFLCYDCDINLDTITVNKELEIIYE